MHSIGALALAAAPMFLVARADLDFDGEDLPAVCRSICRPMVQLTQNCDASDLFDGDDRREDEYERNEDRLRAQCVCTNDSFDVANVASTCADCIRQNLRSGNGDDDDDDYDDELEDINDIIRTCGFATTASFASTASDAASSITVVATAPTAASQLTTTISGATARPDPTQGQNGPDSTSNNDNTGATSNNDNDDNPDSWAAPGAVPLGGLSGYTVLCSFGAFVAGAAVFLL